MADEEAEDLRFNHIKLSVQQVIDLDLDLWQNLIWKEDNIAILKDFLDTPTTKLLLVHFDRNNKLVFSVEIPKNASLKKPICIFRKNIPTVSVENCKQAISFFNIFNLPFKQYQMIYEKVISPMCCSPLNNKRWPEEIACDISIHFQNFRNFISYHYGLAEGRTVLLIPETAELIDDIDIGSILENDINHWNFRNILKSIADMISHWIPIVREVLEQTSEQVFLQENLGPLSEIKFWNDRKKNLQLIYFQVNDPLVRKMLLVLEKVNNCHYAQFRTFFQETAEKLDEAREICHMFEDMLGTLEKLDDASPADLQECLPKAMQIVTLSWMQSEYYKTVPSYITILLQKVCCLLTKKINEYLEPISLFKEDRCETTEKVRLSSNIIDIFLKWYDNCRHDFEMVNPKPYTWVFPDIRVFAQFETFINRLNQIKGIFDAAEVYSNVPYDKLTNVQQASFRRRIIGLKHLFFDAYETFEQSSYNPLETETGDFVKDYDEFSVKLKNLDSKMGIVAGQVCLSYVPAKDGFKFLPVLRDVLKRPLVQKEFKSVISSYSHKVYEEVVEAQEKYSSNTIKVECEKIVYKNLPPISSCVQWLTDECERILPPFDNIRNEPEYFKDVDTYGQTFTTYREVASLLAKFDKYILEKWSKQFKVFLRKMEDHLFIALGENIVLNFNSQVAEVFQEIRYLKETERFELLPPDLIQFYEDYEHFFTVQSLLANSTQWYNDLQKNLVDNEKVVIATEWDRITELIKTGVTKTWKDDGLLNYAEELYLLTQRVYENTNQAKRNISDVEETINVWNSTPLFVRESPVSMIDFTKLSPEVAKLLASVKSSALLLQNAYKENLELFKIDPSSEEAKQYCQHVESLLESGLKKSIASSLQYISENTNPSNKRMAPFYKISVTLDGELKCAPPLTTDESGNLIELFENMIENIYSPSKAITRLLNTETTYYDTVGESKELKVLKDSIIANISMGAQSSLKKTKVFNQYSDMWQMSVEEVLEDFVLYGPVLENQNPEEEGFFEEVEPEFKTPSEDEFKTQILEFEKLYKKVEDLPVVFDIESWLIMDVSEFKKSLLSTIINWSDEYKKKLIEMKRLGKLRKLEDDGDI